MPRHLQDRIAADTDCEQCNTNKAVEPHPCTNQAQWHDSEEVICNCCETCQELCRRARAVPF